MIEISFLSRPVELHVYKIYFCRSNDCTFITKHSIRCPSDCTERHQQLFWGKYNLRIRPCIGVLIFASRWMFASVRAHVSHQQFKFKQNTVIHIHTLIWQSDSFEYVYELYDIRGPTSHTHVPTLNSVSILFGFFFLRKYTLVRATVDTLF